MHLRLVSAPEAGNPGLETLVLLEFDLFSFSIVSWYVACSRRIERADRASAAEPENYFAPIRNRAGTEKASITMEPMANLREETIEKIQGLIEINIDSYEGFKDAAESVENQALSSLFRDLAATRSTFASQLQGFVRINGEEAENSGSLRGSAHRAWLNFRSALNGGDAKVILIEAERGEDAIKEKYEDVLEETAGTPLNGVLIRQYQAVKAGHDRVRDLRDSYLDN